MPTSPTKRTSGTSGWIKASEDTTEDLAEIERGVLKKKCAAIYRRTCGYQRHLWFDALDVSAKNELPGEVLFRG